MNARQIEIIGAVCMSMFVLFFLWQTGKIDLAFSSELETLTGPRAYPRIILSVMGLLCAIQVFQALRLPDVETGKAAPQTEIRVALMVALVAGFAAAFEPVGYILTAPLLVFFAAHLYRANSLKNAVAIALIVAAVILIVFRYGLSTVLPEGILGIDQVL